MAKKVFILLLSALLAQGMAGAQTSMTVPHGSFEQWTTHPGYNISSLFLTLPVYESFSVPTGWDYLTYPVNETFSMGFQNVTVNTSLPLIKAMQDTAAVPDSSTAVKLQTFMLSDIIGPAVYLLVSGSLDSTLTATVYPSILSTGVVNIEHFIPIMNSLMANMDSAQAMLASLATIDVNYLITGGLALDGFEPTYLTGSYKYHSATGGDNGGVLVLGTRYNNLLHKREVVGGGVNIALTDCTGYTPFTVDYMSLHQYDASFAEQTPDSLVIMLVSSASLNRQQGSWLCVDSLALWHVDPPAPDTCASIVDPTAVPDIHEVALSWGTTADVDGFEMEFGPSGFEHGSGTWITPNSNTCTISGLRANTQYDVWIRSVCSDNVYGGWMPFCFTTLPDTCSRITHIGIDSSGANINAYNMAAGYVASWESSFDPEGWEVEYGLVEASPITLSTTIPTIELPPLQPGSQYKLRVRTVCDDSTYGSWDSLLFHTTDTVPTVGAGKPISNSMQLTLSPNPAHGQCVASFASEAELRLYTSDGRLLQTVRSTGEPVTLQLQSQGVFLLQVISADGSAARKIVNR